MFLLIQIHSLINSTYFKSRYQKNTEEKSDALADLGGLAVVLAFESLDGRSDQVLQPQAEVWG